LSLSPTLSETSGLIRWNNQVWTHNDSGDINLYALDTTSAAIVKTQPLTGKINTDWEDIAQDKDFIYVGDFGNNANGNRTDLKILKISKFLLLAGTPFIETINFTYSNQTNLNPTGGNNTDFDCEAMVVSSDSIYLFTKQWVSEKTSVYRLSTSPGTQVAKLKATFDVKGLITGGVYLQQQQVLGLCGYSKQLQPFAWLLYDFKGQDFFGGNKRKVGISLPFTQTEGIATNNGLRWYLSNEAFVQAPLINTPQKLHVLNLEPLLGRYLARLVTGTEERMPEKISLYPNPSDGLFTIESAEKSLAFQLVDLHGRTLLSGTAPEGKSVWSMKELPSGIYLLKMAGDQQTVKKIVRR
ncbi:MAG: T9SS type A sorting domain-containing protein, partial [Bacteroidota bacterium]